MLKKLEKSRGSENLANVAHWRFQPLQGSVESIRGPAIVFAVIIWRTSGPENFQSPAKKDFFNKIGARRTSLNDRRPNGSHFKQAMPSRATDRASSRLHFGADLRNQRDDVRMTEILQTAPRQGVRKQTAAVALTALGVVYGDIGTSTLYGLKQAVEAAGAPTPDTVMGVVSLILWALLLIVALKYAILILRADNHGEGGIVALLALLDARRAPRGSWRASLLIVGLIGAALLYGDGVITPAISVLSAVEGLKIDAPGLAPMVVPITIAILAGLFLVQRRGTEFIGRIFGPVMLVWFVAIGLLGLLGIMQTPGILAAISPHYAVGYLVHAGPGIAFAVLGAAFLALTGAEAMYADMGHFGRLPIQLGWFAIVLPALMLNYFGQGGLLLADPHAVENPFYLLAPRWAHYPMVGFATIATVIASQSIISGAYSLTQQAMQQGFLPRMRCSTRPATRRGRSTYLS